MKTRIILVRHGQTIKNIEGVLHSRSDDSVLSELGQKQVEITANRLKIDNVNVIYSSKEKRALESAQIIAKALGKEPEPTDGLEERNWGIYEGRPWLEVKSVLDTLMLDQRYAYVPENGESWEGFEIRAKEAAKKIISQNPGKTVVIVTHGGVIRVLMPYFLYKPKEESFQYDPKNASITIFDFEDSRFTPVAVDDTSHLNS